MGACGHGLFSLFRTCMGELLLLLLLLLPAKIRRHWLSSEHRVAVDSKQTRACSVNKYRRGHQGAEHAPANPDSTQTRQQHPPATPARNTFSKIHTRVGRYGQWWPTSHPAIIIAAWGGWPGIGGYPIMAICAICWCGQDAIDAICCG